MHSQQGKEYAKHSPLSYLWPENDHIPTNHDHYKTGTPPKDREGSSFYLSVQKSAIAE
jgi:hypothetical protein